MALSSDLRPSLTRHVTALFYGVPPRAEIKEDMKGISVIVSAVEEGLPTIISDGCLYWDSKRQIAPRWWFGRYG